MPHDTGSRPSGPRTAGTPPDGSAEGGRLLGGRYRVGELLGVGGMARVHRAFDERLRRPVAVKILASTPAGHRERFAAEVRILARLDHPNLVRVLDAGVEGDDDYLVMELVDGVNLAQLLADRPVTSEEVAVVGAGVASALQYVHGQGIVHRDIKPANILLGSNGKARLTDFGIARAADSAGFTQTGTVVGTPAYLSPEQLGDGEVGPPTDVYALALVLAESLTGAPVFRGDMTEMVAARLARDPELPGSISPDWRLLLRSMTARDPKSRPSAGEASAYLETLADAGAPRSPAARTLVLEDVTTSRLGGGRSVVPASSRGRQALLALGLIAAILLGLLLGRLVLRPTAAAPPAPTTTVHRSPPTSGSATTRPPTTPPATTVPTTTSTSTTTTVPPPPTVSSAAAKLVGDLTAGEIAGTVTPQAARDILGHLTALLYADHPDPRNTAQQYQQLVHAFQQDSSSGGLGGAAAGGVGAAIQELGRLLGVSSATTTTGPPGPGGPGA